MSAAPGAAPAAVLLGGLLLNYAMQRRRAQRYEYSCERCGQAFPLSPAVAALAPHRLGGRKWVRCPSCRRWSWAAPVPKA